jgi:hypothetical protein
LAESLGSSARVATSSGLRCLGSILTTVRCIASPVSPALPTFSGRAATERSIRFSRVEGS